MLGFGKSIPSRRAPSSTTPPLALKRIAVQGGSFDPPTLAHIHVRLSPPPVYLIHSAVVLQMAAQIVNLFGRPTLQQPLQVSNGVATSSGKLKDRFVIDEVWTVPCGLRPDKPHATKPEQRLAMLHLAFKDSFADNFPVRIDPVEVENGAAISTFDLMQRYEWKWPKYEFWFAMGNDLVGDLDEWEHGQRLILETRFIIFERNGFDGCNESHRNWPPTFKLAACDESLRGTSSTEVRSRVKRGLPICDLVTPSVAKYIERERLYL